MHTILMDNVEVHVITVDGAGLKVNPQVQVMLIVDVLQVDQEVVTNTDLNVLITMMTYVVTLVMTVVGVGQLVNPQVQVMLTVDVNLLHNSLPSELTINIEYSLL